MGSEGRAGTTGAFLSRTPFVGRESESARLRARLEEARAGRGGLVMLVGEPGIGKTRTAEEFAEGARTDGATVLWGRCYEGEWAPPYGPFTEALAEYVRTADADELRADLGYGVPPVARLVPALREKLPDIEEPAPLQPDEERFRLLDAVSQFLIAVSRRAPVVLVLDDLHWADKGTIAMLRHVARFAKQNGILIAGAYRDVELESEHPLLEALGSLRAENVLESVTLGGLDQDEAARFVSLMVEQALPATFVSAISQETDGNPFFIREVLLHLVNSGALYRLEGGWQGDAPLIEEIGLPAGIREAIERRLAGLSHDARRLLSAASAFAGGFPFGIVARTAGIEEQAALDALDEALSAQIVCPSTRPDACDFTHALFRHTLYAELSPPRQVRLHRQIAEAIEGSHDASGHTAEIAYHYHQSATLPGAERGADYAIAAADKAEAAYAHENVASFLRMALELLPDGDARQTRLLGRRAVALALALEFDEAVETASRVADLIAAGEGESAAAAYLADIANLLADAGFERGAWKLSEKGIQLAGSRRDVNWAKLKVWEFRRLWGEDPEGVAARFQTAEVQETLALVESLPPQESRVFCPSSREQILSSYPDDAVALLWAGEYRRALSMLATQVDEYERKGRIGRAVFDWARISYVRTALGQFGAAQAAYERSSELAQRLPGPSNQTLQPLVALFSLRFAIDPQHPQTAALAELLTKAAGEFEWASAGLRATASWAYAMVGNEEEAWRWFETLLPMIDQAPGWSSYYTTLVCQAAFCLWLLGRVEHVALVERNLREKTFVPDFRMANLDSRLSLARLSALRGRHDEAVEWFAKAREVLDGQGARPLRAIVDYDEALMYVRRGRRGDRNRAAPLVEAALGQFREIGMTGWIALGEELERGIAEKSLGVAVYPDGLTPREADVLRLIAAGRSNREISEELTLSVRTVARHIANIYTKIGTRNKAEATAYASRHGID